MCYRYISFDMFFLIIASEKSFWNTFCFKSFCRQFIYWQNCVHCACMCQCFKLLWGDFEVFSPDMLHPRTHVIFIFMPLADATRGFWSRNVVKFGGLPLNGDNKLISMIPFPLPCPVSSPPIPLMLLSFSFLPCLLKLFLPVSFCSIPSLSPHFLAFPPFSFSPRSSSPFLHCPFYILSHFFPVLFLRWWTEWGDYGMLLVLQWIGDDYMF